MILLNQECFSQGKVSIRFYNIFKAKQCELRIRNILKKNEQQRLYKNNGLR